MNSARGIVVSVDNCATPPSAVVEVQSEAVCARCAAGKGCGAGMFSASQRTRQLQLALPAGRDVLPGDTVTFALPGRNLLRAAMLVYGVPLLGAALGAGVALLTDSSEPVAVLAALLGLALGLVIARTRLNDTHCTRRYMPRILY